MDQTPIRVLAVDDSRTIRDMVALTLRRAGFDAATAQDGEEGLRVFGDGGVPDVIVTDINMPKMDGFGFIAAIRERAEGASVPILVLTTEDGTDLKMRARAAGANGWIVKPFDPPRLVSAVRAVALR